MNSINKVDPYYRIGQLEYKIEEINTQLSRMIEKLENKEVDSLAFIHGWIKAVKDTLNI